MALNGHSTLEISAGRFSDYSLQLQYKSFSGNDVEGDKNAKDQNALAVSPSKSPLYQYRYFHYQKSHLKRNNVDF